jgi:RNA polymerase primary sigma factor
MKPIAITSRITKRETESFNLYLKDIYCLDILTPAEETALAIKANNGDKKAKNELVERNLRFVVSVAKQYANSSNPLQDLVNEGNIGLIIAADKFKPEMGWRFISYAVWWIQKLICEHLAKYGRTVRLPANKINNLSKLDKKLNEMEQKFGRSISIDEMVSEVINELDTDDMNDTQEKKAIDKLRDEYGLLDELTCYSMDSLDREIGGGDDGGHTTLGDMITDNTSFQPTDHLVVDANIKEEVNRIINSLKPREKKIMISLFGLGGNPKMSLKEVGDEIGVTREMIRQIKEKVLLSLKKKLKHSSLRSCQ